MIPLAMVIAGVSGMWWVKTRKPGAPAAWTWLRAHLHRTYHCCARNCPRVFDDRYERWLHERRAHQLD